MPQPMMPGAVQLQGIPSEVLESLRAEAMSQAQQELAEQRAQCDKQVHLARVRVAELEKRVERAEADGDEMSARLTMVEVQKAEVEKARETAEAKLARLAESTCESERMLALEEEVGQLRSEKEEMEGLKKTVMVLADELKRRMKADGEMSQSREKVKAGHGLEWIHESRSSPEDTDYVTDSRSGSDTE